MTRPVPLAKTHFVFFATYFGIAFGWGLVKAIAHLHTGMGMQMFLGFLLPSFAAFVALRRFMADHGRGLAADERVRLVRTQLIALAVLTFLGMLVIRSIYNDTLMGMIQPLSFAFVLFTPVATAAVGWAQLWIVYAVLNDRLAPASAGPMGGAAKAQPRVRVLVLGSGAAAHALAWKLGQSPRVLEVLVAPGNGGTATTLRCRNVPVVLTDADAVVALARREMAKLVVLTHADADLVARLRSLGFAVVGPSAAAIALGDATQAEAFAHRHALPWAGALAGTQIDATALVDDDTALLLGTTQARAVDGATVVQSPAPNTLPARIVHEVLTPIVQGLAREQGSFGGFLHVRLRVSADGAPQLASIHAGLDDLHTPAWMLRMQSDVFELLDAAAERYLDAATLRSNPRPAMAQILSATSADAGQRIATTAPAAIGTQVFHQATRREGDHAVVAGTHVLTVCALGDDVADATRRAADAATTVGWATAASAMTAA